MSSSASRASSRRSRHPGRWGLLDDVALIPGPPGEQYVLKTDAIVEGVHFLADDPPEQVAQKLLRVNLSDLAAKGAAPFGYLLMTALPKARDEAWLERFAAGLAADQATYGIGLLGGNSVATPGPATLSVTAIGRIAAGRAVLRRGARTGDRIYVSGTVGDAALGVLAAKGRDLGLAPADRDFLVGRFRLPQPRLNLGARLVGLASSMMDISDGLVADLGHLSKVSGVAAIIEAERLPLSPRRKRRSRAIPRGCRSCWAAATITSCCSPPPRAQRRTSVRCRASSSWRSPRSAASRRGRACGCSTPPAAKSPSRSRAMSISERILGAALAALVLGAGGSRAADRSAVSIPVPGQAFFVQLSPIFVPVIEKDSISRQVSIAVAIEIADGAEAKGVEAKRPTLDDAFLSDVYGYVQQRGGIGGPRGELALKERLRQTAQRILEPVEVREVEIEEFFEQSR